MMRLIATNRLTLEPLEPRHASHLYEGLCDAGLYLWLDEKPPPSVEWLRGRYERLQSRRSPDGSEDWLNWAIWSVGEERYVGYVQATLRKSSGSVAYVVFANAQKKGFASEAVAAMIEELFANYDITELSATVDRRNIRSRALLAKLEFAQLMEPENGDSDLEYYLTPR